MSEILHGLFKGRLGRLHYFLGTLVILGSAALILYLYPNVYIDTLFTILTVPITVRRLHDIGFPGFWAIGGYLGYLGGAFILITIVFNLCLYIIPGSREANNYGEPPKPGLKFIDAILNKTEEPAR